MEFIDLKRQYAEYKNDIDARMRTVLEQESHIRNVAQLGSLAGKYHSLAEKTRQVAQRALHEQEEIEKLENELDELAQLWQTQWLAHRDNSTVTEEIGRIMNTIEQEQDSLQRQYREGQKNYQQVLQTLQALRKRTRMAQVKIDDSHVIDINGRMIAFR